MYITHIYIEGFKRFEQFELDLNEKFNIIVGDNETGKSSLLEAIGLVLTGKYGGRLIQYALDPYLFNIGMVTYFFDKCRAGITASAPRILIEAYLDTETGDPDLAKLKGANNTKGKDCPGLTIMISTDNTESLKKYVEDCSNPVVLPIEFYKVVWKSFSDEPVNLRNLPFRAVTIDTSLTRAYRGPNRYLGEIIEDVLNENQRRELSLEYTRLRLKFAQEPGVEAINEHLQQKGNPASSKRLSVQMDMSSRSSWDSAITAHLDDIPFYCVGKGEQSKVQLRLAIAGAEQAQVLLIEEPENHLSHANLNVLLNAIKDDCLDHQVIITTHSNFVLNKLGVDNLRLISRGGQAVTLNSLTTSTRNYFMKLPGYNTLRMVLSTKCILVEGPSDELIVQRAYKDKYGKLPIEDGVDVITVGSLSFKRFLEIAVLLNLSVKVILDNDGDVASLQKKYSKYISGANPNIHLFFDKDESYSTLEPQLLKANSLEILNKVIGKNYTDESSLLKYMKRNKTDCALKMFATKKHWTVPEYIANAIEW